MKNDRKQSHLPDVGAGAQPGVKARLHRPGLRRWVAAAAIGSLAVTSQASFAGNVIDYQLIQIMKQIRDNQRGEFRKNVDRWEEVEKLLREYTQYTKAEEQRHKQWQQNNTMLDDDTRSEFNKTFRDLSEQMREVKGTDPSSKAIRSGLNSGSAAEAGAAGADSASLRNINKLIAAFTHGTTDDLIKLIAGGTFLADDSEALKEHYSLLTKNNIGDLMTLVEQANAGLPNAQDLNRKVKTLLELVKHKADENGDELKAVQATAQGSASRLKAIEALVAQAGQLGQIDPATGRPRYDGTKLNEVRANLIAIRALQTEELVKLNAKAMGHRATDKLMDSAGEAAILQGYVEQQQPLRKR